MSSFSQRPTRKKIKSPDYMVGCCKLYKPKKPKDFCSWAIVKKKQTEVINTVTVHF